ncbi:MAG: hypothetical protein IJM18_03505, partial [Clostridia bacterium]|nr:hypothetical protein [Clostridia bacterium]
MKCPRCGFDNPDYLEYCRNCSAELPANKGENAQPAWGFVKAPKWSEPDFSADSVSEDDIPEDFVSETETFRKQREAERRAAAEAAAEKARQAAEAAAAKLAYEEDPLTVERKSGDDKRTFERRYADEQRAAERKAEEERLLAERRSAEESERTENVRRSSKPQYSYDDEEDDYEDDYDDAPARKSIQLPAFLTNLFKRREKNNEDYDDEENGEDYDDFAYEKRYAKRSAKKGGSKFNLNTAIRIAAAVAALALLGLCIWLIASGIKSCSSASKSPTGSNKAPIIERDPDDPSIYYVTVFAKNGKVLIYETSNGTRQEATVDTGDSIKFKVFEGSLMPTEPIDDVSYPAQPKVYVKND